MVVDIVVDVTRELLVLVRRRDIARTRPGDLRTVQISKNPPRYFITAVSSLIMASSLRTDHRTLKASKEPNCEN